MTEHVRRASDPSLVRRVSASWCQRLLTAVAGAAALAGWVTLAPPVRADGDLLVSARGTSDARVVITSARGARQVETDTDGDGVVSVRPNAGAGTYDIEITANGVTDKTSIEVPQVGTLAVSFAPEAAAGSRITSEIISRVEEITVTGLRIEESLQDVPATVTALTAETLEALGADDFVDYARNVPALNFADLGPNRAEINLRGMGKLTAGNATVGVYIDDIAVGDSFNNPDLKLFDVERVEVLHGPQGTLYGESAMGGAIRLVTSQADPAGLAYKLEGGGSSTEGGGDNWNGSAMVNLPAPRDTFGVRLVGYWRDEDGWVDNPVLGLEDLNFAETEGARLSARWFATESSIFTLTGTLQSIDAGGQPFTTEGLGDLEQITVPNEFVGFLPQYEESDEEDLQQAIANFQHVFSWAELTVIGGWIDREYDRVLDVGFGVPIDFTSDQKIVSGEARLAASSDDTNWVSGLYYKKWDQDNAQLVPAIELGNFIFFNTENMSAFGEATHFFNDKWSGTAGARIFEEDKHDPFITTIGGEIVDQTDLESSESDILPKLGLAYDASPNLKLYLNGAEGYRAGGVNPIVSQNPDAPPTFDEDRNRSFELGLKSSSSAGKLVFNAAVFHVDWEDMQISGTPDNSALGYTTNAGDAHTEGIEAELVTRPLQGLDISLGGSLIEAELDEPAEGGAAGNRLPHTLEEMFFVSAQQRFPITETIAGFVRGDLQYRGDAFSDVRNRDIDFTDSYTLGNLHLGIELGRFEVTAYWRNVSDERGELAHFTSQTFDEEGNLIATSSRFYRNLPETIGLLIRING